MEVSDSILAAKKPKASPYKVSVAKGLFLLVMPTGSKLWRLRYKWQGKDQLLSLGEFPVVDGKMAYAQWLTAQRQLLDGINPSAVRRESTVESKVLFRFVCESWLKAMYPNDEGKAPAMRSRLVRYVYPTQGARPFKHVKSVDLQRCLEGIMKTGATSAAHACRKDLKRIYNWACHKEYATANQAQFLDEVLKPHEEGEFAGFTDPRDVGRLLRAIDGYRGRQPEILFYLKLAPYFFMRPGELRKAKWKMFDLEEAEWRVPVGIMKKRREHVVPLPTQAIALLKELKQYSGDGEYLFPGTDPKKPISNMTPNAALQAMGFDTQNEHTSHGWRKTASTLLSKLGYREEVREAQLAHVKGEIAGRYNKYEFMDVRRPMMQAYADYLDSLRATLPAADQRRPAKTASLKSSMSASSHREATSLGLKGRGNSSRAIMR
jgi:integrase